jgi:NCS1 family nucleobase:cation symporter-1
LDLKSLYVRDGAYHYKNGWNTAAVVATLAGTGVALAGAFWEPMRPIYDFSWFIGFGLSGGLYYFMMRGAVPPTRLPEARLHE